MEKLLKLTIMSFCVLTVSVSCARKDETVDAPVLKHSFIVEAELPGIEEDATKGYLGSFVSASWSAGDKASVVNLTTGKILGGDLTANGDGIKATFSGTVSGSISVNDRIAVVYPSFEVSQETPFGANRQLHLSGQTAKSKVPLVTSATFVADKADGNYSGLELSFSYAVSYLKINMANLPSGVSVSKVTLRNLPVSCSVSINDAKTGFDIGNAINGNLEIGGPLTVKETGALSVSVGVIPCDASENRNIVVTVDGDGDYISPLTSAKLASNKYYNTVASSFEKIALAGKDGYGVYNLETGVVMDEYDEFNSSLIVGTENGENDFSLINTSSSTYWTVKGIPSDVVEGAQFSARLYNYGINNLPSEMTEDAAVRIMEPDGDFTKLWVKAGDYLFIVRK